MTHLSRTTLLCALIFGLVAVFGCDQKATKESQSEIDANESTKEPADKRSAEQASDDPGQSADGDGGHNTKHTNRLVDESSPYLKLHAHNPVDWYPWGEEALAKAKKENKLIFLSVGYSSCYWCHVMERESFMDEEIAAYLNENFVCVKVDREERPDVDNIYMTAIQLLTKRGGWPMTVFLAPDTKPFFGGTYFPARDGDRGDGTPGFFTLAKEMQRIWTTQPDEFKKQCEAVTEAVKQQLSGAPMALGAKLDASMTENLVAALDQDFDPDYGGFGYSLANPNVQKFPEPSNLVFLLTQAKNNEQAKKMLIKSLEGMEIGGIWDHLGGGFHRYSVDRFWHIPHFEKMLYDNGQLASVYAEAYAQTKREDFRRVVEQLVEYVLREMRDETGGFYSALDAESEKVEGKYYRWDLEETKEELGDDYSLFAATYGFDGEPNFEEEYYVPQLASPLAEIATKQSTSEKDLESKLVPLRKKLLAARSKRPRPLTDNKILTGWNGLMIRGLADAGRLLDKEEYIQHAATAADFVLEKLLKDGRLLRTYSNDEAKLNAYLDDYAFLVDGLLGLHLATSDEKWLQKADQLTKKQIELFWDEASGGFYFTSSDHESLIARGKQIGDGALPAGNSVSAQNLLYLAAETNNKEYIEYARKTALSVAPILERSPKAAPRLSVAIEQLLKPKDAK